MESEERQIPTTGPLSVVEVAQARTGVTDYLFYGGTRHLRHCFRIPIDLLHFNIENGRYHTKYLLLRSANPGVNIDPCEPRWHQEIIKLLNGTYEDPRTGVHTRAERPHFEALVEDIKIRGQERPGIVLENGGVMSGNRRLAALITLWQPTQEPRYQYFEAFIVPGEGGMSSADRWRLEMSAQLGQGRLLREYDAVDRLLKIREGVTLLMQQSAAGGEAAALKAVATDFGTSLDIIKADLDSLRHIEDYLHAIGHHEEWWRIGGLTEVFTEFQPLVDACETNALPFGERAKLKLAMFQIVRDEQADYRLIRDIRTSIGPTRRRRGSHGIPSAARILIDNAPSGEELRRESTRAGKNATAELVDRFRSEFQANREQESPLVKAQRAETNLRSLVGILHQDRPRVTGRVQEVTASVENSRSLADEAIEILERED